jgi:hypothetical protein
MNTLKNVVKKAVAVGSGTLMLGATIGVAFAADLGEYPSPFIKNGQFDGLIVVGEKAASSDIIGAIDIAASLQAASTTPVSGGTGGGSTTVLTGDVAQIGDSGDLLEIGEFMGAVTETLTDSDLEMLKSGTVSTQKGTTAFTQTLDLDVAVTGNGGKVVLDENHDDEVGTFLFLNDGDELFTYELEFTSGLESDVDDDRNADDLEDEAIYMLGQWYTVVDTDVTGATTNDITMELVAGDVTDTLSEGETKTYTIDDEEYEVSVLVIGERTGNDITVKFLVNGEATDTLTDGDTDTLSNGLEIGVRDIIETNRNIADDPGSIVEFWLGANKIEITDADVGTENGGADVEINRENIEDLEADINAVITGNAAATEVRINSLVFTLLIDANDNTDIFLAEGEGVRGSLDEPEGMLAEGWDVVYQGLSEPEMSDVLFTAEGDDQYELTFTNRRGNTFTVPYAFAGTSAANNANFGDEDDALVFAEDDDDGDGVAETTNDFLIGLDDYFVLTDGGGADNSDDSYVLQFSDVDEDDSTVTFEQVGTGAEVTATYTPVGAFATGVANKVTGDITVGGKDFEFSLYEDGTTGYRLAVDLDGSGAYGAAANVSDIVNIVVRGGGILTPANEYPAAGGSWFATLTTLDEDVDSDLQQSTNITFTETTDEIDADWDSSNAQGTFFTEADSDADKEYAINAYGTWFEKTDETDESDSIAISYPLEQVEALVYVTGGEAQSSTSFGGGSGTRVNPISVGSAVLDKDVRADQDNMIVVGGPCVNTMAAQLLGNPADCAEGFEAGHAMIKLFDTGANTALLVAGYDAQDTVGASRVVAEYADYDLSGMEVDVAVESLKNIQVSSK